MSLSAKLCDHKLSSSIRVLIIPLFHLQLYLKVLLKLSLQTPILEGNGEHELIAGDIDIIVARELARNVSHREVRVAEPLQGQRVDQEQAVGDCE